MKMSKLGRHNKNILLSVLMVTRNRREDVLKSLCSLACQKYDGMEIIVMDNGSTDGSYAAIRESFPGVVLVRDEENPGLAAGLNRIAKFARGKWLFILNDDTFVPRGTVSELVAFCESRHGIGGASPRILDGRGSIEYTARRFPGFMSGLFGRYSWLSRKLPGNPLTGKFLNLENQRAGRPFLCDWGSFAAVMVKREVFEGIGGIDEGFFVYWCDADFFRRMERAGWEFWCNPEIEVFHMEYFSPVKKKSSLSIRDFHMGAIRYYFNHHGLGGLNPLLWIGAFALLIRMCLLLALNGRGQDVE